VINIEEKIPVLKMLKLDMQRMFEYSAVSDLCMVTCDGISMFKVFMHRMLGDS
jgi:hypothetical protein